MEETNYWKEEIGKINIEQINKLSLSIENSLEFARLDAENEIKGLFENTGNNLVLHDFYSKILLWKTNHLNSKASDYFILSKYSNNYLKILQGKESEKISKVAILFFLIFKKTFNYSFDKFCKEFSDELFTYKKSEFLYLSAKNIIEISNNNTNYAIKFPPIDNFEIDTFKNIRTQLEELRILYNDLVVSNNTEIKNLLEEKYKISDELNKKIDSLEDKLYSLDLKFDEEKYQKDLIEIKLKSSKNYSEILKNEAQKKDYLINPQFNNLFWGDNYPALKVFYNFLIINQIYSYGWSYFALQMSLGNLEVIQLYTGNYTKRELGYLLYQIQPFFSHDYKNTQKKYLEVIKRKFAIDDELINDTFCKNNIRGYKKSKEVIKSKEEIDFLCSNIALRYL